MAKSRLFALLTGDHLQRAQHCLQEGDKAKAAELFAKAGELAEAARLACEIGDERRAIDYSLKATLGQIPTGFESASAEQVGELLARSGFHREAAELFDLARAYRQAAESLLKLQQPGRAARFYERAKALPEAALYYRRAGMLEDAVRVLELESNRLKQQPRRTPAIDESLRQVDTERAELLAKLGKAAAGAEILQSTQATPKSARLLEEAGRVREAIEAHLKMSDHAAALQLLNKNPDVDRRVAAQVYLAAGRPNDAGQLYAALGLPKEAAEAYEAGGDWAKAGARWETAREPQRAAHAFLRAGRPGDAGRCFVAAGNAPLAAASFAKAGDHANAAAQFLKAGQPLEAATVLLSAGDRVQAARMLTQVQPRDPGFRQAMLLLVPLLIDEQLYDEALRRLRLVPEEPLTGSTAGPTALDRLYWEARALEGLGKDGEALACYRKLVVSKREHRDAGERMAAIVGRSQSVAAGGAAASSQEAAIAAIAAIAASAVHAVGAVGAVGTAAGAPTAPTTPLTATSLGPTAPTRIHSVAPAQPGAVADSSTFSVLPQGGGRGNFSGAPGVGSLLAERYDILAELGRGGMGRVYKARDRELGELVAIKTVLHQGEGSDEERLLREVQICRRITHPNVVRVFDLGRFPGGIFITMELLEGDRLDRLGQGGKPVPFAQVRTIVGEIAAGLEEAHSLGVVHRDLKPGNVILTAQRVKILDFGIARMAGFDTRLTQTGFAVGSPMYMSPEQLQGTELDGRADLYSLGILTYTLIAGREPFQGTTATALALQHLQTPPPDIRAYRADIPAPWLPFLGQLLAKRPGDRFQSAAEVRQAAAALPG